MRASALPFDPLVQSLCAVTASSARGVGASRDWRAARGRFAGWARLIGVSGSGTGLRVELEKGGQNEALQFTTQPPSYFQHAGMGLMSFSEVVSGGPPAFK